MQTTLIETQATKMEAVKALGVLSAFMGARQLRYVADLMRGEEKQFYFDKLVELANVVQTMPKSYETDGQGLDAIVHLHYFVNSVDLFITERDMEPEQFQAYGLADLFGDGGEIGYINIVEATQAGAELDFHWTPKTLREVRASR